MRDIGAESSGQRLGASRRNREGVVRSLLSRGARANREGGRGAKYGLERAGCAI